MTKMSDVHVLTDTGSLRVTVEHGQWDSGVDEDIVADLAEEIRFHSLDEQTVGHRSSWSGFEDVLSAKETRHGGRRSHPTINMQRPMSPGRLHVLSDVTRHRHRSSSGGRRFSASALKERSISDGYVGHGQVNTTRLIRLSRDATQPNSGSVSDLRGEGHEEDEETDVLPALSAIPVNRPRSFTCPDIKAMQRKTKVKLLHRPPTPTPGDDLDADGLSGHLESSCALSNSGEIFVHDEEDELSEEILET